MPLTMKELKLDNKLDKANLLQQEKLCQQGGFPEAYLGSRELASRWRLNYIDRLIMGDVLDFGGVADLRALKLLVELLRHRVGSPLSYRSLSEDLQLSATTIKKYVDLLEDLFIIFRITPFSRNIARSLLKEPKIYFYDSGMVYGDEGVKFENFMALNLLEECMVQEEEKGIPTQLQYIRTKDGVEVDFCIVENYETPKKLIEVKIRDVHIHKGLIKFQQELNVEAYQILKFLDVAQKIKNIHLVSALNFYSLS